MKEGYGMSPQKAYLLIAGLNQLCVAFTFGTYVLFLRDHIGLNAFQLNIVNVAFYLGRFLLEVPTGVIADRYGRKISCVTGFTLFAIGLGMYWMSSTFIACVISELVLAVGATCLSGAFDAWIKDEMKLQGASHIELHMLIARSAGYEQIALIVGAPLGGLGAWYFGLTTPWLMACFGMTITAGLAWYFMRESRIIVREGATWRGMITTAVDGAKYASSHTKVRIFVVIGVFAVFGQMTPNMQWAPRFADDVGSGFGTGILFGSLAVVLWIGSRIAPKLLLHTRSELTSLGIGLLGMAICIGCVTLFGFPLSLGAFVMYELFLGIYKPIKKAALANAIDSDNVATVLSFEEMATKLAGALGLFITGAMAAYVSPESAWIIAALAFGCAAYVAFRNR